ncbi:hypothetical protein [Sulfurimonas sp.]
MKEIYGAGIMFFYFLKWPILLGLPWMYTHGLKENYILDVLWLYCLFLLFKDIYAFIKKRKDAKEEQKPK